ncbi:MAG TPA: hypothetical protein VFT22_35170 [Kofleriaceae bacterium]|nr:hypothetical protein [Kofleriaceae bacterium]
MKVGASWMFVGGAALAGCSLLYNPANLPGPAIDAAPDAPPVVVRDQLELMAAGPHTLFEGQGTGGSRPAVVAITGKNIADDAVVTLIAADASTPALMLEVDNEHAVRSYGVLAVPVTLPIDPDRGEGLIKLTVQVSQPRGDGSAEPVTQRLEGQVVLHTLPELDAPITSSAALAPRYARVQLPGTALSFTPGASGAPVVISAVGSIELGDVHADASGQVPGPGGASGGPAAGPGGGPGGGKPAGLLTGGVAVAASGGGFGTAGENGHALLGIGTNPGGQATGDDYITSYPANAGSGGGGGAGTGGGAGGTLELTSGGTLTVGKVSADGGTSATGGGGSGGAIILRAGARATFGAVTASGGTGANAGGAGNGGAGRVRYDAPSVGALASLPSTGRRGVAFSDSRDDNPLITRDAQPAIKLVSEVASAVSFKVFVLDADGTTRAMSTVAFDTVSVSIELPVEPGYNQICVTPPSGNPGIRESTNCIDLAHVP